MATERSPLTPREIEEGRLAKQILELFRSSRGSYGYRKITALLNVNKKKDERINHKRVERIMRKYGLRSKIKKQFCHTTDSDHNYPIAENLLERDFSAAIRNEKMVSDTTEIQTKQGSLYVAGIIDLYGRMPVGFAMGTKNDRFLVIAALEDMLDRGCGKPGCIVHSDRGSTYASEDYRQKLEENHLICSMSKKGDCWDNAPMESFWGKMKEEWLKKTYSTIDEAKADVYKYVWQFYPNERPHESLGYQTPAQVYNQDSVAN